MKQIRTPLAGTPLVLPPAAHPCGTAQDMPPHPADELAQIRAELARLHQREDALRRFFREDASQNDLVGTTHSVTVLQHKKRSFDVSKLPQSVLANPTYYRDERRTLISTKPNAEAEQTCSVPKRYAGVEGEKIADAHSPETRLI